MTYKELIDKHLKGKPKNVQLCWIKKMIKILNQIEQPDICDRTLLVILGDLRVKLS